MGEGGGGGRGVCAHRPYGTPGLPGLLGVGTPRGWERPWGGEDAHGGGGNAPGG